MDAKAVGVAVLALSYVVSQFYRAFMAVLYVPLTSELGASAATLSLAQSVWFAVFAFAQFPIGTALDRIGPRATAALLLALGGGGGAALFGLATEPWMIVLAMGLIGLGCAPILMASLYIFARMMAPSRFATYTAAVVAFGTLGNVAAAAPLGYLVDAVGWRDASMLLALVTLAVAAAIWVFCQDPPRIEAAPAEGFGRLLRMRQLWLIFPLVGVSYATPASLRGFWAGPYFNDVFGMGAVEIGEATFWMALGMAIGPMMYGPLDRIFGAKKGVALSGTLVTLGLCAALALASGRGALLSASLFAGVGLFGLVYPMLIAHSRGFFPPHLIGRGVTLVNFFSIGGVAALQLGSGQALEAAWDAGLGPAEAYSALFWFYVAALGVGLLFYAFSREAEPAEAAFSAPERPPEIRHAPAKATPAVRRGSGLR